MRAGAKAWKIGESYMTPSSKNKLKYTTIYNNNNKNLLSMQRTLGEYKDATLLLAEGFI